MHMAEQHRIDGAEARIVRSGDGTTGIVENAGSVRIFENHRPVQRAEFAVMAAQRCHVYRIGQCGRCRKNACHRA